MTRMEGNFIATTLIFMGFAGLAGGLLVGYMSDQDLRKQAFDRGYMVECVGKSGYYWECEK